MAVCVTVFDELLGSLTRDGTGAGKFNLQKLRKSGIRHDDVSGSLDEVGSALAGTKKTFVSSHSFDALVDTLYFMRSLTECLLDADDVFLRAKTSDFGEFLSILLQLGGDTPAADRVAVIKYWTAWPMAKWLRNETPPAPLALSQVPKSEFPIKGPTRRHFRNLLASRTTNTRAGQVFLSLLQGAKRGCAEVNEEFKWQACVKHKKALTQDLPDHDISAFESKFDAIWQSTNTQGVKPGKWKRRFNHRKLRRELKNPSTHASYEVVRSGGGRAAFVKSRTQEIVFGESTDPLLPETSDMLDMYVGADGKVITRYGTPMLSYPVAVRLARQKIGSRENLEAQVELCLEPLKCRVITKGESIPYWVTQTFQKAAWKALQDCPCFALTGIPVDASHLYGLEQATKALGLEFDLWVSGDYSAATDGLSSKVNQSCLRSLLNAFDASDEERLICQRVLGNHRVTYPKGVTDLDDQRRDPQLDPFIMKNGQLMGSIISFPVLCAINAAAYWCALEEYTGRSFRKEELPCLINGDDILFMSNDAFYQVWQKWIGIAGFTLSVGKNYISPNFITVNSESWLRKEDGFHKLQWLNCGLLLQEAAGPKKIPLRAETAERPLIAKLQWVLDNSVNKKRTFDRLKHYWKRSISIWTRDGYYNLCTPIELGGCGLRVPEEIRDQVRFTKAQRVIAGAAYQSYKAAVGTFARKCPTNRYSRVCLVDASTADDVHVYRGGYLRLRDRLEPEREHERRISDPVNSIRVAADLLNCQVTTPGDQPTFRIREIQPRAIGQAFKNKNYAIIHPFDFPKELRLNYQGPTDDASLPVPHVPLSSYEMPEKKVEMATETLSPSHILSWTDSESGFAELSLTERRLMFYAKLGLESSVSSRG